MKIHANKMFCTAADEWHALGFVVKEQFWKLYEEIKADANIAKEAQKKARVNHTLTVFLLM